MNLAASTAPHRPKESHGKNLIAVPPCRPIDPDILSRGIRQQAFPTRIGNYAMKLVDLFCGCGGFSLGAHRAGFEVASAYDNDTILTSSYPVNFPNTQLFHRDIKGLSGNELVSAVRGELLGIFGGPPCQGFSEIGRRSKSDPRRELIGHFFRVVSEAEPSFFVMENVRGLAYPDSLPVLRDALGFVRADYDILGPHIWDASEFGAATRRSRVFLIGIRKDLNAPITQSALDAYRHPAATVKAAIADLAGAQALSESPMLPGFDRWKISGRSRPSDYALTLRSTEKTFTGHRPTEHTRLVAKRFASIKPGEIDVIGRHPRLEWSGQCPTLRAGTGSDKGSYQAVRPIHPAENRVITVREAARLQGFPDSHIFHPTVWHSFRMIGNSVSPLMAEAIFKAIRGHLETSAATLRRPEPTRRVNKPGGRRVFK